MFGSSIVGAGIMQLQPRPIWYKVADLIDPSYFSAVALTNSIPLFQLPGRGIIHGIKIKHEQSFAGGGITAYTVSVGITGTLAKYATAFDVFQVASPTAYQLSSNFSGENDITATQIFATATSTTADLNVATTGLVNIWALLSTTNI